MTKIGSNLKKIRQTKGLSQQAFAELFNISRGNISSYEENRAEPKVETIIKIANYFSIDLESLLTKDLSINEILQYNADKLLESENRLSSYKIREIPYINDDILVKVMHGETSFNNLESFPKIALPMTTFGALLSISFNTNIPHHKDFENFQSLDLLIFDDVTNDNVHLAHDKLGIYLNDNKIKLGKYTLQGAELHLKINDQISIPFINPNHFWMLHGVYTEKISSQSKG